MCIPRLIYHQFSLPRVRIIFTGYCFSFFQAWATIRELTITFNFTLSASSTRVGELSSAVQFTIRTIHFRNVCHYFIRFEFWSLIKFSLWSRSVNIWSDYVIKFLPEHSLNMMKLITTGCARINLKFILRKEFWNILSDWLALYVNSTRKNEIDLIRKSCVSYL